MRSYGSCCITEGNRLAGAKSRRVFISAARGLGVRSITAVPCLWARCNGQMQGQGGFPPSRRPRKEHPCDAVALVGRSPASLPLQPLKDNQVGEWSVRVSVN